MSKQEVNEAFFGASTYDYLIKFLLCGDSGCGKTCLLRRYAEDTFIVEYISTIGIDFKLRTMSLDGKVVKAQVWDTAGQERFRGGYNNAYYQGAHAIFVCFDVTDLVSFRNCRAWLEEAGKNAFPKEPHRILVGCKADLQETRAVSREQAEEYAASCKLPYFECSSKTAAGVNEIFDRAARLCVSTFVQSPSPSPSPSTSAAKAVSPARASATTGKILHAGFLTKRGKRIKNWKVRWFVLTEDSLSYFKDKEAHKRRGCIRTHTILGATVVPEADAVKYIKHNEALSQLHFFRILTPSRIYICASRTPEERSAWLAALAPQPAAVTDISIQCDC